jgi:hypothetical protein
MKQTNPTTLSNRHTKVTTTHLQRVAYIYVRQSSFKQVAQHQESQVYQTRLQQRALALGWSEDRIQVIDSDLGISGRGFFENPHHSVTRGVICC